MKNALHKFSCKDNFLAPSILAADFSRLGQEVQQVDQAGANFLHIDIMDGHFVPNLSMGPSVVKAIRPYTKIPFDVHLMVSHPGNFISPFCEAGADHITIHVEAEDDLESTLSEIRSFGCSAGIAIKPSTDVMSLYPYLKIVDLILVMTVEPGFGGQKFLKHVLRKTRTIRQWIDGESRPIHLEVDGGINFENAALALNAGVNILVAGTSIFKSEHGIHESVKNFKKMAT